MDMLATYLPMDRRQAIARGVDLPEQTVGAALIADLSGFTPLTHSLVRQLGERRGAEELARHLDLVYDALIAEVDRYGGTIIGFSGDALTAWFDAALHPDTFDAPLQATTCALAMQQAMQQFALTSGRTVPLAVKVAVASGPARRFVVGDPEIQLIDVVAGMTLDRAAAAEQCAQRGEVILDAPTAQALGERVHVVERRREDGLNGPFVVADGLLVSADPCPWPLLAEDALRDAQLRPWLLRPVSERLRRGQGEFLAEFRPAVALFLRFAGIDYDDDAAPSHLDRYIRQVQATLAQYEGFLIQLTIGDKGSYLYAAFGAPLAHDDDARRAVAASLALRSLASEGGVIPDVRIGISRGRMRTGSYGGRTRRTYGVLGDETNLAARLMQQAAPHEVVASEAAHRATRAAFRWERLPPLQVKGRSEPLSAFRVLGPQERPLRSLAMSGNPLPLVGREAERARIGEKVAAALGGHGQIVAIVGEAGVGKSRLVAEVVGGDTVGAAVHCSGQCQSYGTNSSYLVWQGVWRAFFDLDPDLPADVQIQKLEATLTALDPSLRARLPLLGVLLNLPIPENDLTRSLDAHLRKASLEELLVHCLRVRAQREPILLILEDCHWLDPLSHDLLEVLGRAIADLPVLVVVTSRATEGDELSWLRVRGLAHFTVIRLVGLTPAEANELIGLKLAQLSPARANLPPALLARITHRAQGNPFYLEELVNYLHDRSVDHAGEPGHDQLDLPASLHSLILSRIDQLSEDERITVTVASVIGRQFRASWLWGAYPELGEAQRVCADLERLTRVQLTVREMPEPELSYLFRHVTIQEVAYATLASETRARLHDRLGQFLERAYAAERDRYVDVLAYHYERSPNVGKQREYLRKAGEAAQAAYANDAAIYYYQQLLLLLEGTEKAAVLLRLAQVLDVVGRWDEAVALCQQALELAEHAPDPEVPDQPTEDGVATLDAHKVAWQALLDLGLYWTAHDYARAGQLFERALELARQLGDPIALGHSLNRLGNWYLNVEQPVEARRYHEQALAIFEGQNDRSGIAETLDLLGVTSFLCSDASDCATYCGRAAALFDELDDRQSLSSSLAMLADAGGAPQYDTSRPGPVAPVDAIAYGERAVRISREINLRSGEAFALLSLGSALAWGGEYDRAFDVAAAALAIADDIEHQQWRTMAHWLLGTLYLDLLAPDEAQEHLDLAIALAREIGSQYWLRKASAMAACAAVPQGELDRAAAVLDAVLAADSPMQTLGQRHCWCARAELALARGEAAQALEIVERLEASALGGDGASAVPRLSLLRGRALIALQRPREAEIALAAGESAAAVYPARSLLWRIRVARGKLAQTMGKGQEADRLFSAAGDVVEEIAASLSDGAVRERFLREAGVRISPPR